MVNTAYWTKGGGSVTAFTTIRTGDVAGRLGCGCPYGGVAPHAIINYASVVKRERGDIPSDAGGMTGVTLCCGDHMGGAFT